MCLLSSFFRANNESSDSTEWHRVIFAMKCYATSFLAFLMQPLPGAQRNRALEGLRLEKLVDPVIYTSRRLYGNNLGFERSSERNGVELSDETATLSSLSMSF